MDTHSARDVGTALSTAVLASESFDAGDSAALFVGVRLFRDGRYAEVPCAIDDAVDLAHTFVQLGLVGAEKTLLCLHGDARKPETAERLDELRARGAICRSAGMTDIYEALDRQRLECGEHGIFLVGVASHGISHDGKDLVLASDTVPSALLRTSVEVTEIFNTVGKAKAPRRLVLLDACRERMESQGSRSVSGGESGSPMTETFAEAIARATGQVVLSGTVSGGYSYDDTRRGNGVFSAAVIDGLRGKAPGDDRNYITVETLASFVETQVQEWLEQHAKELLGIGKNFDGMCKDMPLAAAMQQTFAAPSSNAEAVYRAEVREYLANDGAISPIERLALQREREERGISEEVALSIEAEEMQTAVESKRRRLESYVAMVEIAIQTYGYPVPPERNEELQAQQTKLRLQAADVEGVEARVAAELVAGAGRHVEHPLDDDLSGTSAADRLDASDDDLLDAHDESSGAGFGGDTSTAAPVGSASAQRDDVLSQFVDSQILFVRSEQHGDMDLATCGVVTSVSPGSPAERLGVVPGDIVISVNGTPAGELGGSLHRSAADPTTLELRTVRTGHLHVETTGVDPGFGLKPTPEAVMADPEGCLDSDNFTNLWELGETSKLWALSLLRASVKGSVSFSELAECAIEQIPELYDEGALAEGELSLLYIGGVLTEFGVARGIEMVSSFEQGDMRGYTMDQEFIVRYYKAVARDTEASRARTLMALSDLYLEWPSDRVESAIRRLGGTPPAKRMGRVGQRFPVRYRLRELDGLEEVSLDDTLEALGPDQLHIVCLMDGHRSNGPYHFSLFDYRNLARHMPRFLPSLHVLTSTDGGDDGPARQEWYEHWMRQEQVVRGEGLPLELLYDKRDKVCKKVDSMGTPHFLMLDSQGIVRFDSEVDDFGVDAWSALHRLLRASA